MTDGSHPTPTSRTRTAPSRPRRTGRRAGVVILVMVLGGAAALVITRAIPGTSAAPPSPAVEHSTTSTTPPTTTTTEPPTTTTEDPGSLPQTAAFPSTTDPTFTARMNALWAGVADGATQPALPAFFPQSAYRALKTVGDPSADYTDRLLAEFGEDLVAAHDVLGADPATATLVGVNADAGFAHWVPAGVCSNTVGYYELPNARIVYSVGGQVRSFGIASMISWRGEWYVVHLGAVLRSGAGGEVDSPEDGTGTSGYSSTC